MATIAQAADLDGNGIVDGADQSVLLASWGTCPSPCPSDLNGDGVVDGLDFAILLDAASSEGDGDTDTVDSEGLYADGDSSDTSSGGTVLGPLAPDPTVKGDEVAIPIHNVPLPAPVWMGLAGLAGAAVLRRRLTSRAC